MTDAGRAVVVATAVIVVAAVAAVSLASPAAAAGPTVAIHDVNGTATGALTVNESEALAVNYTLHVDGDVRDAAVVFTDRADGATVRRAAAVPDATTAANRTVTVDAPAEGFYNVSLVATEVDGTDHSARSDVAIVVETPEPTVTVDSPADGDSLTDPPLVSGTAFDGTGIENVTLAVENERGDYWNDTASSWQSAPVSFVVADPDPAATRGETVDWAFDFYDTVETAGNYTVTANARDADGANVSDSGVPGDGPPSVSFELVSTAPRITAVSLPASVTPGEDAAVSVTVEKRGSTDVGAVTLESDALGLDPVALSTDDASGPFNYTGTVTVPSTDRAEGPVSFTATADAARTAQSSTETASTTLDRVPANVSTVSLGADFVGVVDDPRTVSLTASGVTDAAGNPVSGDVDVVLGGHSWTLSVDDGDAERVRIDPSLAGNATADEDRITARNATTVIGSADVEMVHRVYALHDGWNAVGTPMDTTAVLCTPGVVSSQTYDAASGNWTQATHADVADAGAGYYLEAANDSAYVGFELATGGTTETRTETLDEGWNLVGPAVDLTGATETTTVDADLTANAATDINESAVNVSLPSGNAGTPTGAGPVGANWTTRASGYGSETIGAFSAYWVYVDDGEMTRSFEAAAYDPASD